MLQIFKNICETIEKYDSIVIFGHLHPDGDCFGSQVGLRETILSNWPDKKVYLAGSGFKKMFPLLGGTDAEILTDDIIKHSLAFLVDFFEFYRAEDQRVRTGQVYACLDHHEIPDGYKLNNVTVVDSQYGSACGLIFDFIKSMNLKCTEKGYTALLSGVISDTARFLHLEKDNRSLKTAYELMNRGADEKPIYHAFSLIKKPLIDFKGYVYTHYQNTDNGVLYCVIKHDYIVESNFTAYPGFFVNSLADVEGYPVWAFFIENGDGSMQVEIRSLEAPVVQVAAKHGGGGHTLACGIMKTEYSQEKIDAILKDLGDALTTYTKENEGKCLCTKLN